MYSNTKVQRANHTISAEYHDSLIMLDPVRGKYLELNPVAKRIWELIEEPITVDDLASILLKEYNVPFQRCFEETREILEKMMALELLQADLLQTA